MGQTLDWFRKLEIEEPSEDEPELSAVTRFWLLVARVGLTAPEAALLQPTPAGALLLAELVNHLAKVDSDDWYRVKPEAVALARELGCDGGWGPDGAFYLFDPAAGSACFHDPYGELEARVGWRARWLDGWSGIHRQARIREIIRSPLLQRAIALVTSPPYTPDMGDRCDPLAFLPEHGHTSLQRLGFGVSLRLAAGRLP